MISLLEGIDTMEEDGSLLLVRLGGFGIGSFLLEIKPKSLLTLGWRRGVECTEDTLCFRLIMGVMAL